MPREVVLKNVCWVASFFHGGGLGGGSEGDAVDSLARFSEGSGQSVSYSCKNCRTWHCLTKEKCFVFFCWVCLRDVLEVKS